MKRLVFLSGVAMFQFAMSVSYAQGGTTIIAERPGFSSSPVVLSPGVLQIESGYRYTHDGGSFDLDDHTLPFALVRIGLVGDYELQLNWSGWSWREEGNQNTHGSNDLSVGVKRQVTAPGATVPLALFAGVSLPTGDRDFTSDGVDPTLGAFWAYGAGLDWFGTLLLSEVDGDVTLGNAIGLGFPISGETSAYVEYFGKYGGKSGPENTLNGGIAYLPRNDMQLDVHAGVGLNSQAPDLFIGFGLAYRF